MPILPKGSQAQGAVPVTTRSGKGTAPGNGSNNGLGRESSSAPITQEAHDLLIDYVNKIITQQGTWWRDKLERIDMIYYCMQDELAQQKSLKERAAQLGLTDEMLLEAPIAVSQIETAVSVLADTFLSGYPIFGIVAPPERRLEMEQVETLIAHFARESFWTSSLLKFFTGITKYGIAPIGLVNKYGYDLVGELDADVSGMMASSGSGRRKIRRINAFKLPEIISPDPYNLLFDFRVAPNLVATQGDYFGYSEMLPLTTIKAQLIAIQAANESATSNGLLNLNKLDDTSVPHSKYYMHPSLIHTSPPVGYWDGWLSNGADAGRRSFGADPSKYYHSGHGLLRKMWLRLVPTEFKLGRYGGNTPMVFNVWTFNDEVVIYFAPVYLKENAFPIGLVDVQDDYFGYGSKSDVELFLPFQRAASTLLNAAVMGAERSVDDRAIYDSNFIDQSSLTKAAGSGYIPLTRSLTQDRDIRSVYHSIPFDASSAYAMPSLIRELVNTSQMLRGRNNFAQGLPMKGNRTLGEFSNVMQNADTRQQLPALKLEELAFTGLKSLIKQWISANATKTTLLNHRSKSTVEIDPQTIADLAYEFTMTTGYFSKATVANTNLLQVAFQTLQQDPNLAAQYDTASVFAYLLSIGGLKDMDQFKRAPEQVVQGQPQQQQPPIVPGV